MSTRGHVLEVLAGASAALGLERDYINDLNVYPVPDGDTGTNLFLTVQAIIDEVDAAAIDDLHGLMAVVTRGSLMGARGNSGVILSQIVRGACESIAAARAFDAAAVRDALREASDAAYRAVRQPVEGTMLSVVRAMAEAAADTPDTISLPALLTTVTTAGSGAWSKKPRGEKVGRDSYRSKGTIWRQSTRPRRTPSEDWPSSMPWSACTRIGRNPMDRWGNAWSWPAARSNNSGNTRRGTNKSLWTN